MTEPKRIGRPPTDDPWCKLTLNLKASELVAMDRMRGAMSRPAYVRYLFNREERGT